MYLYIFMSKERSVWEWARREWGGRRQKVQLFEETMIYWSSCVYFLKWAGSMMFLDAYMYIKLHVNVKCYRAQ